MSQKESRAGGWWPADAVAVRACAEPRTVAKGRTAIDAILRRNWSHANRSMSLAMPTRKGWRVPFEIIAARHGQRGCLLVLFCPTVARQRRAGRGNCSGPVTADAQAVCSEHWARQTAGCRRAGRFQGGWSAAALAQPRERACVEDFELLAQARRNR